MDVLLNGVRLRADQAMAAAAGEGCAYGFGLFETLKFAKGHVFFAEAHWRRFSKSCTELGMPLPLKEAELLASYRQLIRCSPLEEGALRVQYAKGFGGFDLLIAIKENRYVQSDYENGFRICIASGKRNPYARLTYIKSCNYLENLLEKEAAQRNQYDEAIFLNTDGLLSEGTFTNLFWVKDGVVRTPAVSCGILPGILRDELIGLIRGLGLPLEIGAFTEEDLQAADEVFLTNALMEIMPVSRFYSKLYDLDKNCITQQLRKKFKEAFYPSRT